ncbi:ABC transporter ATP-binding protein [unidentified eubacterium SCB49]|nr:ABC transporter ATP-binding protein [unidentified eubacterium SCB49]
MINFNSTSALAFKSLYEQPKNSADIIIIGNSHSMRGIDTEIIDAKCKTSTLNISIAETSIVEMYNNLREVLAYQKPKLVIIECWPLIGSRRVYNLPFNKTGEIIYSQYNEVYFKKFGLINIEESIENNRLLEENISFIDNKDKWQNLEKWQKEIKNRKGLSAKENIHNKIKLLRSYDSTHIKAFDSIKATFNSDKMYISDAEKQYLAKIIELSKEYDFKLLMLTVPVYDEHYKTVEEGFIKTSKEIEEIASKHENVYTLDINKKFKGLDYTHFLKEKHITENQHLTYKGIIKTTNITANFIKENFSIQPYNKTNYITPEKILYHTDWQNRISKDSINILEFNNKYEVFKNDTISTIPKDRTISIKSAFTPTNSENKIQLAFIKDEDFVFISKHIEKLKKSNNSNEVKFNISLPKNQLSKGNYSLILIEENTSSNNFLLHPIKQKLILQ